MSSLGTGLLFHYFSMMDVNGLSRGTAAALFVPLGFWTAASNLATGYLMDRVEPRVLTIIMLFAVS